MDEEIWGHIFDNWGTTLLLKATTVFCSLFSAERLNRRFYLMGSLKKSTYVISLNARGLKGFKRQCEAESYFSILKRAKIKPIDMIHIQETNLCDAGPTFWSKYCSVVTLTGLEVWPYVLTKSMGRYIQSWLAVGLTVEELFYILLNIYGYNNSNSNKLLLLKVTHTEFILIGGDFNLTPDDWLDSSPFKYSK